MRPRERMRFPDRHTRSLKTLASVLAGLVIVVGAVLGVLAFGLGQLGSSMGSVADQPFTGGDGGPFGDPGFDGLPVPDTEPYEQAASLFTLAARLAGLMCGLPMVLIPAYVLLRIWRGATWLDGTVLTRRGVLLRRSVDLSTAGVGATGLDHVRSPDVPETPLRVPGGAPELVLTEPRSGRTTRMSLRGEGVDLLPGMHLRALAGALATNRSPDAARARDIAALLRHLADNPSAY